VKFLNAFHRRKLLTQICANGDEYIRDWTWVPQRLPGYRLSWLGFLFCDYPQSQQARYKNDVLNRPWQALSGPLVLTVHVHVRKDVTNRCQIKTWNSIN
jgi:hypothetical protein